ncbi:MAG: hypothetical protein IIB08_06280, partial [Bacteroidetes bacterium]|nr:hypothetical protein [Bacteroidota bacterium]
MLVEHNFLVGTQIEYEKSLFFDLMESGDIYLGFARNEPIWGFTSLLKITHTNTWAANVMGQSGGSDTTK